MVPYPALVRMIPPPQALARPVLPRQSLPRQALAPWPPGPVAQRSAPDRLDQPHWGLSPRVAGRAGYTRIQQYEYDN